jgi:hypothetical protein
MQTVSVAFASGPTGPQHPVGHVSGPHKPASAEKPQNCEEHCAPDAVQSWHAAPPLPQSESAVPGWQAPVLSQQPPGQGPQGGGATHACPLQISPFGAQSWQDEPAVPQARSEVPGWHFTPVESQQPEGQLCGPHDEAHTCWSQNRSAGHDWHAAPPVPHAAFALPDWHAPSASQQPAGQLAGVHDKMRQDPPLPPSQSQALPRFEQSAQAPPPWPQADPASPGRH